MTEHSRRNVLRGAAAIAAASGLVGATGGLAAGAPAAAKGRHFPFLEGAFAPVTEELTAFGLPVTGRIPRELNGRYLRNGPNVLGLEDPRAHHWMQGDGMVHGVRLRDGRAEWYRNRWVRSSRVAEKLGEPYPGPVPPDDFPCNTHVIGHRDGSSPSRRAARCRTNSTTSSTRWARTTSAAPWKARSRRTPSSTRSRASCTR